MTSASPWGEVFRRGLRVLLERSRAAMRGAPVVLRKPGLALHWLIHAHSAQIALAVSVLVLVFVFPPVRDAALERLYPTETISRRKMMGLVTERSTQIDPRLEPRRRLVTWVIWLGAGGLVFVLLALDIPVAVAAGLAMAKRRESEADALAETEVLTRLALYRSALSLSPDPDMDAGLLRKINAIGAPAVPDKMPPRFPLETAPTLIDDPVHDGRTIPEPAAPPLAPIPLAPAGASAIKDRGVLAERYELIEELGRGGMGRVYRAYDAVLDRQVALKELAQHLCQDENAVARFRQEAQALARLQHPRIVHVYDLFAHEGRLCMVLELIEGGHLADHLSRGRLEVPEVARLGGQIADALSFSHAHGVVHRDVKPLNVLLTPRERDVKVTDFGLAKLAQATMHTLEGAVLGSPHYMSPEQADGRGADARSDLYALGVILYEMVTGQVPFSGDTASVLVQHLTRVPESPRRLAPDLDVPTELDGLILGLLAKRPEDRPGDMQSVQSVLRSFS